MEQPKNNRKKPRYTKPRPSRDSLSVEELRELDRRERIIHPLAQERKKFGRIGPGKLTEAGKQYYLDDREMTERNVQIKVQLYQKQMEEFENEPERWAEVLIDNRGRTEGTHEVLTKEHILAIRAGISLRERVGVHSDGIKRSEVELQPGIDIPEDVYEFAKGICSDLPSLATVRRAVKCLVHQQPAYYKLLTEGVNSLHRDAAPKMKHTVSEVDEVWSWDFCDLGIYINENGIVCTAVWARLIDHKADKHIHHKVLAKKETDDKNNVIPVTFKKDDAKAIAVTAMRRAKRRPLRFYNDRDLRLNLADDLPYITAPGETPVKMDRSLPGEPWGRGLTEVGFGRRLRRFLNRYNGCYNKRNRTSIRKAIKDPSELETASSLEKELDAFLAELNLLPRVQEEKNAPTRNDEYYSVVSPRSCPPIRRLFQMMPENRRWADVVVLDHEGFNFARAGEKHSIPTVATQEAHPGLYIRWMDAALKKEPVSIYAIQLDRNATRIFEDSEFESEEVRTELERLRGGVSETGWIAEICLNGVWFETIPRSLSPFSEDQHMEARNKATDILMAQITEEHKADVAAIIAKFGALPERLNTTVRGHYRMPKQQPEGAPPEQSKEPSQSTGPGSALPPAPASDQRQQGENAPSESTGGATPMADSDKQKPEDAPSNSKKRRRTQEDWSDAF